MALNGSFSGSILSGHYTLRVDWSAMQNVTNNTSKITAALYLVQDNTWSLEISGRNNEASIAGKSYDWSSPEIYNGGGKTTKIGTVTSDNLTHNADGTKSVTISVTFYIKATINGTYYESITASKTVTLNTIPRATQPTLSASSADMGSNITINMPRASSGFKHDLAYSFAGSVFNAITTGADTSYTWQVPDLASKIPNAASGTVTIRCITWSGKTKIGTKTVLLTVKVPTTAEYMPTINAVTTAEQTSGLAAQFGAYIQGKSKIKTLIISSGAKGSKIKSYSTTFAGKTYTGNGWTSDVITQSGTLEMVTTATDSRGRTAKKTTTISVLAYNKPAINILTAKRTDATGKEDPTNGTYVALAYKYAVTSLNSKNTANFKVEIKGVNESEWTTILTGSDLSANVTAPKVSTTAYQVSVDDSYDLRATLVDYFGASASFLTHVSSGAVIMDLKGDGTGVAFYKVSDRRGVDFGASAKGAVLGLREATASIPEGANLNDYTVPGVYAVESNAIMASLANRPHDKAGTLRVWTSTGLDKVNGAYAYLTQEFRTYDNGDAVYQRTLNANGEGIFTTSAWRATTLTNQTALWTGALYMNDTHTVDLSKPISEQSQGIILVFSAYDGGAKDYWFHNFFIPKTLIAAHPEREHCFPLAANNFAAVGMKYLKITDTQIVGHENNSKNGTAASGIKFDNNKFVLRRVIGI